MGYTIKDIAKLSKPKEVSLSESANYIEFESNSTEQSKAVEIRMQVTNTPIVPPQTASDDEREKHIAKHSTIAFVEQVSKNEHEIKGTKDINRVNSRTYFIHPESASITASNIKNCLMQNSFLANNFDINLTFTLDKDDPKKAELNTSIKLQSLGTGEKYGLHFKKEETDNNLLVELSPRSLTSTNKDSIDQGSGRVSIELEVYTDTETMLGEKKFPEQSLGTYMATLSKSYHGQPLWFNLNTLLANKSSFSNEFLTATTWCDAGTSTDYRLVARKFDGANREPFYLSDVLYCITGYGRNLEPTALDQYVYNTDTKLIIKPLTNQPTLYHVKGQTQYFNFILSDANRKANHQIGVTYRLYTQSKRFVAEAKTIHQGKKMAVVNTLKLDIDNYLDQHPNIGYVEVYLNVGGVSQSTALAFRILPSSLYSVRDFAFLNALGGWSSFNFGGENKSDFKTNTSTIFKTQTPRHTISSQLEAVYNKEVNEQFTVKTMPIPLNMAEWLKEMSSSIAVYELATQRYVVVDELQIKSNSKEELYEVEMKYRYTDTYNGLVK